MVYSPTLLLVQDDLEQLATVHARAGTLANYLDGVDQVGEDGVVNGGQGAASRTLLSLSRAAAV